jgi:hypothetical protein
VVTPPGKPEGNDSDSDSDASGDRNSLDLASSHSSDEDDDFEIGPPWDQHIPKSKAVGECIIYLNSSYFHFSTPFSLNF